MEKLLVDEVMVPASDGGLTDFMETEIGKIERSAEAIRVATTRIRSLQKKLHTQNL